mmetsp:Transcript_16351/g.39131  ORF Transcript_16351/g.39131 Transcript_16351/m.39131 type:complete len:200 (+) Transcript_16351:71-670(+)|eukprot:CAMPEP_0181121720 /NCGR_PEP_ID=MMETSP1071-20121207/24900_1 /TAXON_ID=35127 /ORGANISM="Thalassiosira sp., Strain NH16" /LENGTH=199 /DNA_ID=CAMNT_0023206581 /DNA_START=31 /DNA_END=630 /DNA_ORIENTATION=-
MSCLCIGGVCIPYSALLPMLLIGLRWIAAQFARVGLLPDFVAKRLGVAAQKTVVSEKKCDTGCCGSAAKVARRGKGARRGANAANEIVEVEHIDNLERWQELFAACKNSTLFVKFTAEWCKPCKAIQPAYVSAASKYGNEKCTFVTLDIDGDDCDVLSSKLKIAMMPTFVCFEVGNEAGRMSGGNSGENLNDWVAEMCS